MDSPSEKYPALARALDKKILDGEGNELTTEAAVEMLISSEEYFPPAPHIRTSTAAELERELTRTSKPATMGSALARVRAFVGHPSNLWHGPGYKPGESPLIVLNSTSRMGHIQVHGVVSERRGRFYLFIADRRDYFPRLVYAPASDGEAGCSQLLRSHFAER